MSTPILRVCPECGHENWGMVLPSTVQQRSTITLPPPATCEECDALLVPSGHKAREGQVQLQKVSDDDIPDEVLPCHIPGETDPCPNCPLDHCRYPEEGRGGRS